MARSIGFYGYVAKVQSDAKKHVLTVEIDPDFWDRTPELVEVTGSGCKVDLWPEEHGEGERDVL